MNVTSVGSKTLALLSLVACGKPPAPEVVPRAADAPTSVAIQTAPVETRPMPRLLTLTGSVLADRQSEVAANVSGQVIATYVERGQRVKHGQTLALVDSKAAGLSASAALAQAKAAETQYALAVTDCERADKLIERGSITRSEFDRMKSQCTAQLHSAEAARANAGLAAKIAGDAAIRAPFEGLIGERFVDVGEYVQPMSRVVSMYAVDPARISISVPEAAVALIQPDQTLQVQVSAYPDRTFPAKVKFIAPALRESTRDLVVEATSENREHLLKPGMFATVQLVLGEEPLPTVPSDALRVEGTVKRLFLAREGRAVEMVVRTGSAKDGRVSVLEPLADNEQVILHPPPGLRDGAPVTVNLRGDLAR